MLEQVVFTIILMYLLIVQLFNARLMKPMIEALGRDRVYEQTVKSAWGLCLLLIALVFLFQVPLEQVGLGFAPAAGDMRAWKFFFFTTILISGMVAFYLLVKTSPALRRWLRPYYELEIERLILPRTSQEAKAWGAISWTAGVTEEFIFRGVLLYTVTFYIDVPLPWLALVGGAMFGLAHAYQGIRGILVTGIVGWGLGYLYLVMGILWPIMILHALLDLIAGPIHVVDSKTD
ncbi:CPBP family intramembrane glutamic endopeptidase [Exiguobacterium sp. AM39-5BH]|uniref:CPBP family intramembrane glutamic endopeptidase n=1 Tax=Exiguobacterium sp. AM39-5BH TaxID=2292355 RepID=UPI000FE26C0D|nr:CPBP family intramembrane glutamic endopeptidase [Exiguobacterium sp. AM39-5BH]RHB52012.1 CPBP family intramembrane metalloprotease [Exiguobacterium sp. AM39-5BH]